MHTASKMDLAQEFLQPDINRPVSYLYDHYFADAVTEIRLRGGSEDDAARYKLKTGDLGGRNV